MLKSIRLWNHQMIREEHRMPHAEILKLSRVAIWDDLSDVVLHYTFYRYLR